MATKRNQRVRNPIQHGKARFTVLTDRLIRLEWAADQQFEDRLTLGVSAREPAEGAVKATTRGRSLTIDTGAVRLTYRDDGKPFSKTNLQATFRMNGRAVTWTPGLRPTGNLKGTYRTLDGYRGGKRWDRKAEKWRPIPLCPGLISRDGWAVVDDSANPVLEDNGNAQPWVAERPAGRRFDWYLLAYGHEYEAALGDAANVFGRQPLPPRYTLGYWWSRYWAYTDRELEQLVAQFDQRAIPLDIVVIDMDWHLEGWTGYTWDRRMFPDPKEFLAWLNSRDLKVTLNLHPADGVRPHEEQFEAMCKAMGLDPEDTEQVDFDCTDPRFVDAYFRILHHPQEDAGVDFWWMDWQQGRQTRLASLDPLPWLNHLHWEDMARRKKSHRPLIFSRFGGIGAGRYPIGFSGDTHSVWESLQFQPYFTATASNVLYGYWSHDIGGHMRGPIEPELYLRWVQFGIYSPILRTHTTKRREAERRVFAYPEPYSDLMVDAIRRRYEMVPYIYTENRRCFDTGVSLIRPMYYGWPEEDAAYKAPDQYMFGTRMLVAPVLKPADEKTRQSTVKTWLPPGDWIDTARGETVAGGRWHRARYLFEEIPVFVRPGTMVPGQQVCPRLTSGSYRELVVTAWPGRKGAYDLYEDDGVSQDYLNQKHVRIPLRQEWKKQSMRLEVGPAEGDTSFRGFVKQRSLEARIEMSTPPRRVMVGGRQLPWSHRLEEAEGWRYDADCARIVVRVRRFDVTRGLTIQVQGVRPLGARFSGLKALVARLQQLGALITDAPRHAREASQVGNRIARDPASFEREIADLDRQLALLPEPLRRDRVRLKRRIEKASREEDERYWDDELRRIEAALALLRSVRKEFSGFFK